MIQIGVTGGAADAIETVLPIFPFRVGTNNVPTLQWFVSRDYALSDAVRRQLLPACPTSCIHAVVPHQCPAHIHNNLW